MYVVYIIQCADGSLYTGITTNIARRMRQHNGEIVGGAKYTYSRRPVLLVYTCACETRASALQYEHQIKHMSRTQKQVLVKNATQ